MSKPTWRAEVQDKEQAKRDGRTLCRTCGWRLALGPTCASCLAAADEAPAMRTIPRPVRVPPMDHPAVRRKGYSSVQKAAIDAILLADLCRHCGGVHESATCVHAPLAER